MTDIGERRPPAIGQNPLFVWAIIGAMGLNGVGTINNSTQMADIKKGMLDDLQTRRWIEEGAAKLAKIDQRITHLERSGADSIVLRKEIIGSITTAREQADNNAMQRMNRIAAQHQQDVGSINHRLTEFGKLMADLMARSPKASVGYAPSVSSRAIRVTRNKVSRQR